MKKRIWMIAVAGVVLAGAIGVTAFSLLADGHQGPPQKDMTIDESVRKEAIDRAVVLLDTDYVFPDQGTAIGTRLKERLAIGEFDRMTSAEDFAQALTDALQADSRDKHLGVRYFEKDVPQRADENEPTPEEKADELAQDTHFNFGISGFSRLKGNIGLIDLKHFGRPEKTAGRIAALMALAADTGGLIIDLRQCEGGDPDTVMQFASYLFDHRTHLNDIYFRDENRTEERWTDDHVAGPKYGEARRIYLLTGADTFSGCEDFAYAMKYSGRATLVGATTGGGAHAGSPHRLGAHFMMFVPSGRPINPVTHTDWEGVGVVPDVKVSEKSALDVAQVTLLKDLIARETDQDWKRRLQNRLADF